MIATNLTQQQADNDLDLFQGKMHVEDVKKLPPVAIFTAEMDFCRRDAIMFSEKCKEAGNFLGI